MGKKKKLLNKEYYTRYWTLELTNIVTNLFEWNDVPEEINTSALEKSLMLGGHVIFFKDKQLDKYFALPGVLSGMDVYGYPTHARPVGKNASIMFDEMQIDKECVVIYANKTRTTALNHIQEYADKLADIDVAIKMNTLAMKHPIMITCSEQTRQSFETLMRQYEDDYYVVIADKALTLSENVNSLKLNVSSSEILNLQMQKQTLVNEFFNMFGISGSVEKRERIVSGEINAQMQQVGINRSIWLSEREKAVEKINRMFNTDISVSTSSEDIMASTETYETPTLIEGAMSNG